MKLILVLTLCSVVLVQTFGATTIMPTTHKHHNTGNHHHGTHPHKTHPTGEPVETDKINFRYDPKAHMMAAFTHKKCYLYDMSATESTEVHTSHGLHTLETKLITMIDDTTKTYPTLSHATVNSTSHSLAHICNRSGWTAYKLN